MHESTYKKHPEQRIVRAKRDQQLGNRALLTIRSLYGKYGRR